MVAMLANPDRLAADALVAVLTPPPPVDYLAFAEEHVSFTKRESQASGRYNRERFAYFDEILRALSPDDPCRVVSLSKSAQLGGTALALIFTLGSLVMDPSDVMYVHPTDNNGERWSKLKLSPMLRSIKVLADLFPEKARTAGDSLLYKERVDKLGAILISGANSPASLSQVTMPRQVQDDLSKWERNSAGDPETQADSRSAGVEFAKIFKIGTPLVEPGCRITRSFGKGSQEYCFVPCPHCSHMQVLEWENMLAALDEDRPEDAHFTCVDCGCVIEEYHRPAMLARHEWRADNPKAMRDHRSFHIWSAYSVLQSWSRIAQAWLNAKGDPSSEQVFLNDTVGKADKAQGESPPWEGLRTRAEASHYARGTVPRGALLLCMGIDCQIDRVEWHLVGFGRDYQRFVVEYGVIPGHISEPRTQSTLSAKIDEEWVHEIGVRVKPELAAIDGNAWTPDVYSWVRKHPPSRVMMVRGRHEDWAPMLARVTKQVDDRGNPIQYAHRFYNFGASKLKDALYRNLAKTIQGERGYVSFPKGLEDEYFRQLTSERRLPVTSKGLTVYRWKKDEGVNNEVLDTMNQAEAAALQSGWRGMPEAIWQRYEKSLDDLARAAGKGSADPVPLQKLRLSDIDRPAPRPPRARRIIRSPYMQG